MTNEFDGWNFKPLLIRTVLIYVLVCVCWPTITFAADYYVQPKVDNQVDEGATAWANATNIATPCSAETAMVYAQAGDTVIFLDGVYSGLKAPYSPYMRTNALYAHNSGTVDNPIVFKAQNPRQVILEGVAHNPDDINIGDYTSIDWIKALWEVPIIGGEEFSTMSYTVWDGFVLRAVSHGGTYSNESDRVNATATLWNNPQNTINNCEFIGVPNTHGNYINWDALEIHASDYTTITNCEIHGYEGANGVKVFDSHHGTIRNNVLYDNQIHISLKNGNISYFDIGYNYLIGDTDGQGVSPRSGDEGVYTSMASGVGQDQTGHIIHNNLFVNIYHPITGAQPNPLVQMRDNVIKNNTFYNSIQLGDFVIQQTAAAPDREHSIYNNIMVRDMVDYGANMRSEKATTPVVDQSLNFKEMDHNLYYNPLIGSEIKNKANDVWYSTLSSWQLVENLSIAKDIGCGLNKNPGCGSIVANPLFVNTSGTFSEISDFSLQADSPAKSAGRDGVVDMGANIALVGVKAYPEKTGKPEKPRDFKAESN